MERPQKQGRTQLNGRQAAVGCAPLRPSDLAIATATLAPPRLQRQSGRGNFSAGSMMAASDNVRLWGRFRAVVGCVAQPTRHCNGLVVTVALVCSCWLLARSLAQPIALLAGRRSCRRSRESR